MRLSVYCYTNQGGRAHNEDSVRCSAEAGAFVLADGLGGHGRGEAASALAADVLLEGCAAHPGPDELMELFQKANEAVIEGQKVPGQEEMKTTAVALSIDGERAVWGHIGDSRLYRFSGGTLDQETRDHSVTFMKYLGGEISYMDVYHDDDRSSLLRALGKLPCKPEAGQARLQPGDALLLCSDGISGVLTPPELLECMSLDPEEGVRLLEGMVLEKNVMGQDNFTGILIACQ